MNVSVLDFGSVASGRVKIFWGAVGSTPTNELGYAEDCSVVFKTEYREIQSDTPRLVGPEGAVYSRSCEIQLGMLEWNIESLTVLFGLASNPTLRLGGLGLIEPVSLRIQVRRSDGRDLWIDVWKAIPVVADEINLTDLHIHRLFFVAGKCDTSWAGEALDDDEKLVRIWADPIPGYWVDDLAPSWDEATEEERAVSGFWTDDYGRIDPDDRTSRKSHWV